MTKYTKYVLSSIIGLIVAILIFQAGVFVGYHKASFSYRFGDNYSRNFMGPRGGIMDTRDNMMGGDGASGKIIKISLPDIIVSSPDNTEKTVVLGNDTSFREFHGVITAQDLKVDDFVVVLGTPDNKGEIDAKLVRVLPTPPPSPDATSTATTSNQ